MRKLSSVTATIFLGMGIGAYALSGEREEAQVIDFSQLNTPIHASFLPVERVYKLQLPSPFNQTQVTIFEDIDSNFEKLQVVSGDRQLELLASAVGQIDHLGAPEFFRVVRNSADIEVAEIDHFKILMVFGEGELVTYPEHICRENACIRRERNVLEITVSSDFQMTTKIHDLIQQAINLGATK